jgi:hypothetical protein
MNLELRENYIYTRQLNLKPERITESAFKILNIVETKILGNDKPLSAQVSADNSVYTKYNAFLYVLPQMYELFVEVRDTFFASYKHHWKTEIVPPHYIQCWINRFNKDENIDWHRHWHPEINSWHGFYCAYVEPNSTTTYRVPGVKQEVVIPSKDNLLVLSRSDGDEHRSSEWNNETHPRITIAFDIIPRDLLSNNNYLNHWIPL